MILLLNEPAGADDPDEERAKRVGRLAVDLMEAARELGDAAMIAAAELAAYQAAIALAHSIRGSERED